MKKIFVIATFILLSMWTTVFAEQVQLNEPQFSANTVIVSGNIPEELAGQKITVQIIKPYGTFGDYNSIYYIREFETAGDGSFEVSLTEPELKGEFLGGSYSVYVGSRGLEWSMISVNHDVINVLDYGALNDASYDSSVVIQNAINTAYTCGGTVVYLPYGEYLIQNPVNLKSGITLTGGNGTKLILDGGGFKADACDGAIIDGLEFSGEETVITASDSKNIVLKNIKSEASLLSATDCQDTLVSLCNVTAGEGVRISGGNITVKDSIMSAESLVDAENGEVSLQGCVLSDGSITLNGCFRSSIYNNQISGASISLTSCTDSRLASNGFSEQSKLTLSGGNRNIRIESNVLSSKTVDFEMLEIGGDIPNELIYINSNTFWYGSGEDGNFAGEGICYVNISDVKRLMFRNNYISNSVINIGNSSEVEYKENRTVLENILSTDGEMLLFENVTDSEVSGNSFSTQPTVAPQTATVGGVKISNASQNLTIRNNTVRGFLKSIDIVGANSGINIHGNYVDIVMSEAETSASLYNNKTLTGNSVELSHITNASKESRYYYNASSEYLGQVFTGGEWKNYGVLSDDEVKTLVIEQESDTVTAVYRGYGLNGSDTMITAVYDDGKLIDAFISRTEDVNEISCTFLLESLDKNYVVKSFLWNSTDGMVPIYYTREIKTKTQAELDAETETTEQ